MQGLSSETYENVLLSAELWKKTKLETQTGPFLIRRGKNILSQDSSLIKDLVLFSVVYIMFSLQAHQHKPTHGQ